MSQLVRATVQRELDERESEIQRILEELHGGERTLKRIREELSAKTAMAQELRAWLQAHQETDHGDPGIFPQRPRAVGARHA